MPPRQSSFDGCLHQPGREERQRNRHIDLSNAAFLARGNLVDTDASRNDLIKPTAAAVFGERHLRHLLRSYFAYYNETRTHLSLDKDAPVSRAIQATGRIIGRSVLRGLHHQYVRI